MNTTFKLLLVCVAIVGLEFTWARVAHREEAELEAAARSEDVFERMFALHVLANRGEPRVFSPEFTAELLAESDPRLREFAMTRNFGRGAAAALQREEVRLGRATWPMEFYLRFRKMHLLEKHVRGYFDGVKP